MNSSGNSGRKIKSEKGSSSVLVILIMVTLIVLGLIALMSTFSELKLARKNGEWVKTYYVLDSKAENLLSGIDACLKEASRDAGSYISQRTYENAEDNLLPSNIQKAVNTGWQKASATGSERTFKDNLYKKLYYLYSLNHLNASGIADLEIESKLDFNDASFFEDMSDVPGNGVLTVSSTVTESTEADGRKLLVTLSVEAGSASSAESVRYDITTWKELPKVFKYDDTIDFENLEVE